MEKNEPYKPETALLFYHCFLGANILEGFRELLVNLSGSGSRGIVEVRLQLNLLFVV